MDFQSFLYVFNLCPWPLFVSLKVCHSHYRPYDMNDAQSTDQCGQMASSCLYDTILSTAFMTEIERGDGRGLLVYCHLPM